MNHRTLYISAPHLLAVVVWYNPTAEHATALQGYLDGVNRVIVIDNSDGDNSSLLHPYGDKVCYIPNGQNLGIAAALNRGFTRAVELGAEWVLTMDQDSRFEEGEFDKFTALCNAYDTPLSVGIFSPHQVYADPPRSGLPTYEKRIEVMTSGNIVQVEAWRKAGGFREDYFIDLVDDEFCLRVLRQGWDIIMVNDALLCHRLGDGLLHSRLLRHRFLDHPPVRYYYITRNLLATRASYPERKDYYTRHLKKRTKRLLLYVNRQKWQKILMSWRGYRDFRRGRMGRYEDIHHK